VVKPVGGHVLTNTGWMPEELVPDDAKEEDGVLVLPEPPGETEVDLEEYHIGGDWYNIDGEQIHGYADAARALSELGNKPSMSNTKKELLEAAEVAGVEADESMTKAEILEALEE
jgi:hypothetical protein